MGLRPYWLLAFLLLSLASCSGPAARYPVQGQVLVGDQPVADALVVFHPQFETPPGQPKPLGITDAEGKFQLTTLQTNDCAWPGNYRITVELRQERLSGEEVVRDGPSILPARYGKPETTPFKFSVSSEQNEVPLLNIDKK
jgi:hypothetical protein